MCVTCVCVWVYVYSCEHNQNTSILTYIQAYRSLSNNVSLRFHSLPFSTFYIWCVWSPIDAYNATLTGQTYTWYARVRVEKASLVFEYAWESIKNSHPNKYLQLYMLPYCSLFISHTRIISLFRPSHCNDIFFVGFSHLLRQFHLIQPLYLFYSDCLILLLLVLLLLILPL